MGNNASGRVDDTAADADMDDGFLSGRASRASSSAGYYARGSPPGSPPRPHSPRMFVPQSPVTPLQKAAAEVAPMFNQILMMSGQQQQFQEDPHQRKIPTLLTWPLGGKNVYVEGSWDNWATKKPVEKSGKDHTILLMLPSGIHRYRFIVDGEGRFVPDLPCETDNNVQGRVVNLVDVHDFIPESTDSVSELMAPPSPDSSYGFHIPGEKEFAKAPEPPQLPAQLYLGVLNSRRSSRSGDEAEGSCARPRHVVLDHLYIEKGWLGQPLVALGYTHRFRSKYVTCVLYKAMDR